VFYHNFEGVFFADKKKVVRSKAFFDGAKNVKNADQFFFYSKIEYFISKSFLKMYLIERILKKVFFVFESIKISFFYFSN
jgi:hypothetical protein